MARKASSRKHWRWCLRQCIAKYCSVPVEIDGEVVKITPVDAALKIPHMGWNELSILHPHALFNGIANGAHVYYVHSFEMRPRNSAHVLAISDYGGVITAAVGCDNLAGTQFHPEKSQAVGLKLLANFLNWRP